MDRLRIVTIGILVAFSIIWLRLFYWQVFSHEKLKDMADDQHFYRLEIPPRRGDILASDGTALATTQTAYLVFAEKRHIENEEDFTKAIAGVLEEDEASISARLNEHEVWVPVAHHVDEEKADLLRELELKGIGFEREDKRYYPETSMAAHLLGFVGKNDVGAAQGYFGLEGYYDKELNGQPGYLLQERDATGNPILVGEAERIRPKHGRTLKLYIDKTAQFTAEKNLKRGLKQFSAKGGAIIIMDPKTGGILASASYPSYDPAHYWDFPEEYFKNPVVSDLYEPGSTFKPLVMAHAFDVEAVDIDERYDEAGPEPISGYTIKTWNNEYHGEISMSEILQYSSNVGMVYIAQALGQDQMIAFLRSVGIGDKTGIDLQEEAYAPLRADSEWREIDVATASFGQGIVVTPIQILTAIAAIANDGVLMEPHIVESIIDEYGQTFDIPPKEITRLYSPKTAKVMKELMIDSVEHGEAKWDVPEGFRIAGKTGTAQIAVEGVYDAEKTIASFVGFAPADDPAFVMLVTIKEPESSPWGSETAAPLFFNVANELLPYFGIRP